MSIRIASHLYRNRHGGFYFRIVFPRMVQVAIGRREVRLSLHTERRQDAIHASLPMLSGLPELFIKIKQMIEDDEPLETDFFQKWREEKWANAALRAKIKLLQSDLDEQRTLMEEMVSRDQAKRVGKIMHDKGMLRGKQELEQRLVFPWPPEKTVMFSELTAAYLRSLDRRMPGATSKPPTAKTKAEYEASIRLFITVMGDCHIGAIDKEVVGEYCKLLLRLPPNLNKSRKFRDKTITEILAMGEKGQSNSTVSKKIERTSYMFNWALDEKRKWGIDSNPFTGFGQSDSEESSTRPFTMDEMRLLLSHESYATKTFGSHYMFWLIPLATYTGARINELCQLDVKDIIEVDDVPCFDINDTEATEELKEGGKTKRVKTKNAKRLIPVHPELIRMGFLQYVDELRQRRELHVFPDLSRTGRDGPGQAASKWFGRFKNKVGVTEKRSAVFHSFRHLFITTILDTQVPPHMLAPIVGHEAQLITGKVYWDIPSIRTSGSR